MKKQLTTLGLVLLGTLSFISCSNSDSSGTDTAQMQIRLTDAPADYQQINLDVKSVEYQMGGDNWNNFNLSKSGVINLLDLKNGVDLLLGDNMLPTGTISQIRLVLGSNNTIRVNGVDYPLSTPSAQQSGLKLNVHYTLEAGKVYKMWIDFDAAKSIVKSGNGSYSLKPVIRTFTDLTNGMIEGNVKPQEAKATVYTLKGTDTIASAIPNADGYYKMQGLPTGTYDVNFSADKTTGYTNKTVNNVAVTFGNVTKVADVVLTK
ncbi:DUF4382 domain-containing protein [Elizabethkingia meningoseptica]|uniref:DUF4382 domain-containing protein n=1 Tax=Elizabethkingia meningoseptica TaxID=238 RepID=A0A1V3TWV6_ELIME|nr:MULTISPECIES: DUF4382 domain-containing protein [Elizabethkingia]AQX12500.1 hypothetical protein BBD35_09010 [Elizabethkingia meningoseptica]MCL1675609.1 DUF4382 domain-containing protein [Elizabethkingia meningoseptica]MCL1686975.1 DUF4382 domain-containing protein [Elizabethkingia meningoseptica]MDE5430597.1 DUF4382 domain-containing protein [Elizabethkingia meningoseptica]MDE5432958.1 DUF4382 domain-containing protein [Elizabethkingia meningoseptica]